MKTVAVCVSALAALQVVLSAPQDFNTAFFNTPSNLDNFRPSSIWSTSNNNNDDEQQQQQTNGLSSRFGWANAKLQQQRAEAEPNTGMWSGWSSNNKQLTSRTHQPRMTHTERTQMMFTSNDALPQLRQSGIPVISVPPLLPPLPGVTEQDLYGSVNIDALTAPYSLGDNTTENQTPIQLPPINTVLNGTVNVYDHGFAPSQKVQDVISNHLINTFTNQTNNVQVNNLDLHRFYKLVNSTTNYITNVQRVNQSAIFSNITLNNATEYQPFLYITQSQTMVVNDNSTAQQLPVIESSSISTVSLPPVYDTPVVTKFDYNGNPVAISPGANSTGSTGAGASAGAGAGAGGK